MAEPVYYCRDDKVVPAHQLAASIVDLTRSRQVDKHKLLRGTGIFSEDLMSDKKLSIRQLLQLLRNTNNMTPGNDSAFLLGKRMFPGNYGAISTALLHAKDLSDTLKILHMLRSQICPFFEAKSYIANGRYYLLLSDAIGCGEQNQFLTELYCAALVSASKFITAKHIPFQFNFPFKQPGHIEEYHSHLGNNVYFSQLILSISFDEKYLKEPNLHRSDALKWHAIRTSKMANIPSLGFLEAVKRAISCRRYTSLSQIADAFQMSPATFKRKLKLHGTSFQQLQDELGKRFAVYLLHVKQFSNEESAHIMHFNDLTNFRRSVKRWTGLTPSQLRTAISLNC